MLIHKKKLLKKTSLIVAACNKHGIGQNNTIPWYLPNELMYFRKITTNCGRP